MDIFEELKQRAETEIEALRKASVETDDANKKYKYRKIKVGIEAMSEHIYEVEKKYKDQNQDPKPMTWSEKIHSMSDEELAEFLMGIDNGHDITYGDYFHTKDGDFISGMDDISQKMVKWLQSEAE